MKKFLCCLIAAVITIACMTAVWFCSAVYTKHRIIMEQELSIGKDFIECRIDGNLYLYYK